MRYFLLCLLVFSSFAHADDTLRDMNETSVDINVKVHDRHGKEETGKVVITEYTPDGKGPFPIVLLNHGRSDNRSSPPRFRYGRQARFFLDRGFAVFVPTRIGYGAAGTEFDPENSGGCKDRHYDATVDAGSTEILAALRYAESLPYVDKTRVVLLGQSVGGLVTTAAAASNPSGVIAAINFAGGAGGDPSTHPGVPCQGERLEAMYSHFGASAKMPMLWIYTENDEYFSPTYSKAWHDAFVKAGGNAEYHLLSPFKKNGHYLFARGIDIWAPVVGQFLDKLGFPKQGAAATHESVAP